MQLDRFNFEELKATGVTAEDILESAGDAHGVQAMHMFSLTPQQWVKLGITHGFVDSLSYDDFTLLFNQPLDCTVSPGVPVTRTSVLSAIDLHRRRKENRKKKPDLKGVK